MRSPIHKRLLQVIPVRYVHAIMCFFAFLSLSTTSGILALTITQMVVPIMPDATKINSLALAKMKEESCPMPAAMHSRNNSVATAITDRYDWSEELQGLILGSYYIGFVIMHIPGAMLSERIGAKLVLVTGLACTASCTLLTPMIVLLGDAYALLAIRVLIGALQGTMWASVSTILAAWVPKNERGTVVSLAYCGLAFGGVVGNMVAGLLIDAFDSWHVVFYAFGSLGLSVSILTFLLCTNNPASHPFVTEDEKIYLEKEIGQLKRDKMVTPWRAILTSRPVIASIVDMIFCNWAYFVVMIDLPKYMNDVIHVSVRENGFYSSAPWVMRIIVTFASGRWADWLIRSERLSVTHTRKLFIVITAILDSSFLMAAAHAGCDASLVGIFFIISVGAQGMIPSSTLVVPMDLSPNFAGPIAALTNGIASTTGFIVPFVIGQLTPHSLPSEWRVVFWITFGIHYVKIVSFLLFGSAEVQPWNSPKSVHTEATTSDVTGDSKNISPVITVDMTQDFIAPNK